MPAGTRRRTPRRFLPAGANFRARARRLPGTARARPRARRPLRRRRPRERRARSGARHQARVSTDCMRRGGQECLSTIRYPGARARTPPARRGSRRPEPRSADRALAGGTAAAWESRSATPRPRRGRPRRCGPSALGNGDARDHDGLRRPLVGAAESADPLDRVEAVGHLADDRVVGRQADVGARDDEELAARGTRRPRLASSPSRRRLSCTWSRRAGRRSSCIRDRLRLSASDRPPGSRSPGRCGGRPCRRRTSPGERDERSRRVRRELCVEPDREGAATRLEDERRRSFSAASGSVGAVRVPGSRGAGASTLSHSSLPA